MLLVEYVHDRSYLFNAERKIYLFFQESLEARVLELERALETEQKNGQRERLALTRLQRQLARVSVIYTNYYCVCKIWYEAFQRVSTSLTHNYSVYFRNELCVRVLSYIDNSGI